MDNLRVRLKDVKSFDACNITLWDFDAVTKLTNQEGGFETVVYSAGLYGTNGVVVRGNKSGTYYKVVKRTIALMMIH